MSEGYGEREEEICILYRYMYMYMYMHVHMPHGSGCMLTSMDRIHCSLLGVHAPVPFLILALSQIFLLDCLSRALSFISRTRAMRARALSYFVYLSFSLCVFLSLSLCFTSSRQIEARKIQSEHRV